MEAPEYKEISSDNYFMGLAKSQSGLSSDLRRPIGCVVVQDGHVVGWGSNQATITWAWLQRFHVKHCVRKALHVKRHAFYWLCPGCALYRNHAEARAIQDARREMRKGGIIDMYLYGHTYCCDTCLEKVNKLSIGRIFITNQK